MKKLIAERTFSKNEFDPCLTEINKKNLIINAASELGTNDVNYEEIPLPSGEILTRVSFFVGTEKEAIKRQEIYSISEKHSRKAGKCFC